MGEGIRTIRVYLIGFYLVPLAYCIFFGYSHFNYLKGSPSFIPGSIYIALFLISLYFWLKIPKSGSVFSFLSLNFFVNQKINFALVILYGYLSYKFHSEYGIDFRHSGKGMMNTSGGYVVLMFIFQLYFNAFVISQIARLSFDKEIYSIDKLTLIGVLVCRLWSITSSYDAVVAIALIILIAPQGISKSFLFKNQLSMSSNIKIYFMFFILMSIAFFIGIANKIGIENAVDWFQNYSFFDLFSQLIQRLSIFLYSNMFHVQYNFFDYNLPLEVLEGTFENLLHRIGQLTTLDIPKPEIFSASRMNSLLIYYHPNKFTGASPGLIASTIFFAPFPFGFIIVLMITKWIIIKINEIFRGGRTLSLISILFLIMTIEPILDSPTDMLNPIDNSFVQLFFLYMVWLNRKYLKDD